MRKRAVYALSRSKSPRAAATLREIVLDPSTDADLRGDALTWYMGGPGRTSDDAFTFLKDVYGRADDTRFKQRVLQIIASRRTDESRAFLVDIAQNPKESMEIRRTAIWTLQGAGVTNAQLAQIYDRGTDVEVRKQVIGVLGGLKDNAGVDKLLDIARNEKNVELRKQAISNAVAHEGSARPRSCMQEIIDQMNSLARGRTRPDGDRRTRIAGAAQAQRSLASRIEAVRTGRVRFTFAARDGVCGNGMSWYRTRRRVDVRIRVRDRHQRHLERFARCRGHLRARPGAGGGGAAGWRDDRAAVVRGRHDGRPTRASPTSATSAPGRAARGCCSWRRPGRPSRRGPPSVRRRSADSVDASATLLRIAKNDQRPPDVRSARSTGSAKSWATRCAQSLDSMAYDAGDREVRKQAIYAVSRRPADESVPALIKMAGTLPDRELRKTAVFWLAQSKDPRAVAWVETQLGR